MPALRVTMEQPQALYLRGAVYETYTGDAWQPLSPAERADYGELFSWIHSENYYGQTAVYSRLTAQKAYPAQRMTVETLSACRAHGYLPYGAGEISQLDETLIGDALIPRAQSFPCVPTDPQTLYDSAALAARDTDSMLSRMESSLSAYAQNVDLAVPQQAGNALAASFGAPRGGTAAQTLGEIRSYLRKTITYDDTVETRVTTDFVQQTLEQKRGYSVHYATMAVLLLRMNGIPARYVEGYHLTAAQAEKAAPGETVTLTEANAHAWAEYYLNGVGFVPFEVTPGYEQSDEQDGETPGPSGSRQAPRNPVGTPTPVPDPTPVDVPLPQKAVPLPWLWLLLLPPMLLAAWIALRRLRLRRMLRGLDVCDDRERILRRYAYACALQKICPVSVPGSGAARRLFREAKFSDHAMTDRQSAQMAQYVGDIRAACLQKWNLAQRLYYRWLRGIIE